MKTRLRESRNLEFKEQFDPTRPGEWCEVVKDIVAIANSGGGTILIGVKDDGSLSGLDVTSILQVDLAQVCDKLFRYTGENFSDIEILEELLSGQRIARVQIGSADVPLVFTQPGTYETGPGRQKTAFGRGTIYFRHGAKSEPATSKDLKRFLEQYVAKVRRAWLGNIRKVVTAPKGHRVMVLPPEVVESDSPDATPIRISEDPKAPEYRKLDTDRIYPHRQIDVVRTLNERLNPEPKIKSFDVFCVRKVYGTDKNPRFFHKPKFGSPQYSEAFVEWLVREFNGDPQVFDHARAACKRPSVTGDAGMAPKPVQLPLKSVHEP